MATINATVLSLLDWAKRIDPKGKTAMIVELLAQQNEILADMQWKEGNQPTGELTTVRTGLPTVAWRLLNAGVATSKSTTAQITEQCGMLEAWSEVDRDLAMLNGNANLFRLSEASAFLESMNIEMAQTLFYGNSGVDPEEFTGLSPRYSTISGATNASHVLNAGGSGSDNASVWLVVWGPQTVFGIYPKGSSQGLLHEDRGEVVINSSNGIGAGTRLVALQDHWQWKCGIALRDWRYVVRIANIDISNLIAQANAADLTELMIKAIHRIPSLKAGRPVFYMNRTVFEFLDIQRRGDVIAGGGLTYQNVDGVATSTFRGIPVRQVDALLETEATVT
jgi:hypothetical protein